MLSRLICIIFGCDISANCEYVETERGVHKRCSHCNKLVRVALRERRTTEFGDLP